MFKRDVWTPTERSWWRAGMTHFRFQWSYVSPVSIEVLSAELSWKTDLPTQWIFLISEMRAVHTNQDAPQKHKELSHCPITIRHELWDSEPKQIGHSTPLIVIFLRVSVAVTIMTLFLHKCHDHMRNQSMRGHNPMLDECPKLLVMTISGGGASLSKLKNHRSKQKSLRLYSQKERPLSE